jgi:molybdopterin/thiamine biosynthesis adenylyltransferase
MSERYLRNNMIDWFDQSTIKNINAIVIGAGAIGNEVIKNLALMGVGNIQIYDLDTIEIHNLTKSVLFREEDVGQRKVDVAAKRARELDPNINVVAIHGDIFKELNLNDIKNCDIVFCCLDNFETRLRANQMCLLTKKTMVNMSIDSRFASIEIFPYNDDEIVCYECNLPLSAYERMSKRYSCGHLKKITYIEKKIPTTIMTSSVSASIGVSLGLQKIAGKEDVNISSKKVFVDTRLGTSSLNHLTHNPDCPTCVTYNNKTHLIGTTKKKVGDINDIRLDLAENLTIRLPETIITNIYCEKCSCKPDDFQVKSSRDFTDEIYNCPNCGEKSVKVEIKDELSMEEFTLLGLHKKIFDIVPFFFVLSAEIFFCYYEEK